MFTAAINTTTSTELGNSAVGETLKYFSSVFSDPQLVSLDEFVFNTEAHPSRGMAGSRGLYCAVYSVMCA